MQRPGGDNCARFTGTLEAIRCVAQIRGENNRRWSERKSLWLEQSVLFSRSAAKNSTWTGGRWMLNARSQNTKTLPRPPTKKKNSSVQDWHCHWQAGGLQRDLQMEEKSCLFLTRQEIGGSTPLRCWNVSEADSCCRTMTFGRHHPMLIDVSEALERIAVVVQPPQTKILPSPGRETLTSRRPVGPEPIRGRRR